MWLTIHEIHNGQGKVMGGGHPMSSLKSEVGGFIGEMMAIDAMISIRNSERIAPPSSQFPFQFILTISCLLLESHWLAKELLQIFLWNVTCLL
jgi:hypothetical protein